MDGTVKHSYIKSHSIGLLWFLLLPFDIIENWAIFKRKCEGEQNAYVKCNNKPELASKYGQMEIQVGWKITAVYCMSYTNLNIKYKCSNTVFIVLSFNACVRVACTWFKAIWYDLLQYAGTQPNTHTLYKDVKPGPATELLFAIRKSPRTYT